MMARPSFLYRVRVILSLFLMMAWCLLLVPPVQAQSTQNHAQTGRVTIIVLDMSGSMGTNDPNGVRCSAANAYIDLSKPDDSIGVIGLDSAPGQPGPHNFGSALTWATPMKMETRADQKNLKDIITSKSNHCAPDASTPTYDALDRARKMLETETQGGKAGSVILLTDGEPEPDSTGQIQAINQDLIPEFRDRGWPIDTVALGTNSNFTFLKDISNNTKGLSYNDVQDGVASPLNIGSLFIDLFASRSDLTFGPTISTTQLDGGTTSRDFVIGDFVDSLAVVVVKDDPGATVRLTDPNQKTLTKDTPGTFIANDDPHYAFFSVDKPQKGTWTLSVTGNQSFLMKSLISSSLKIQLISPADQAVLPLGQGFPIAASVTSQGIPIGKNQYSLKSTITYQGNTISPPTPLDWDNTSATYKLVTTIPVSDKPGTYKITVSASSGSGTAISEASSIVQLDNFPLPLLFVPGTHIPTLETVSTNTIEWDPVLRWLYDHPLSFSRQLASWSLQNIPTEPQAILGGQVELRGQPFPNATTSAVVIPAGSKYPIPVALKNNAHGNFSLQFPALAQGSYIVRFSTSGSYRGSNDFGITTRIIKLTTTNASLPQELRAWLFTAVLYPLFLLLFILLLLFPIKPAPAGKYTLEKLLSDGQTYKQERHFKVKRGLLRALLYRNRLFSHTALSDAGKGLELQVNYDRKQSVRVRKRRVPGKYWFDGRGKLLSTSFTKTDQVIYSKSGNPNDPDRKRYIFQSTATLTKAGNRLHQLPTNKRNKNQKGNSRRRANTRQAPRRRI